MLNVVEELAVSFSFLSAQQLGHNLRLIFRRSIVCPTCQLGIEGIRMSGRLVHSDLGKHIGDINLLEDADGSTMPKPMGKELASILVAHGPAPALDDISVGSGA